VFTEDKLRQQLLVSEVQDHIELIKISDHAEGEVKAGDRLIGRSSMTLVACLCVHIYINICIYMYIYICIRACVCLDMGSAVYLCHEHHYVARK
jgi:hypothetical protein